ncbi:4-hydroxybenzoate octaprenyltransferase [Candidatus Erwinia haradaeae]|uniref:4-hydroxybenzoate octaprenyltransferase n=1 Tax=Candidatus Erwinia haradaeae TaxID=1922217 RepID=A0A451D3L4_9GAMM|nr:4-hydroxybenzoate octaprenyltransferase [Candidatus Erwinia haradaeae]VFP80259.1 4-hydroxybenzoate octaprenyltransferase [Candidatus Erwinia haradaeae]
MGDILPVRNLVTYCQIMRINQPNGLFLLLWPTLWALWLSGMSVPPLKVLFLFTFGVFCMRSAGCVINDIIDRDIDVYIQRTQNRPLPCQKISVQKAKLLHLSLLLISCLIVLTMSIKTILFSILGLVLTWVYPFMKRYIYFPQIFLGISFSLSIPMVWSEISHKLPISCWLLFFGNFFWVVAYDTQYAMVDRSDDLKIGIKSTAILFNNYDRRIIAFLQLLSLIFLTLVGWKLALHPIFYFAILGASILFVYQQFLIADRQEDRCFKAFSKNNWVGLIIFLGIALSTSSYFRSDFCI